MQVGTFSKKLGGRLVARLAILQRGLPVEPPERGQRQGRQGQRDESGIHLPASM
jgi:hypothetical protein